VKASATGEKATAIGAGASATGDNSVALGAGSIANEANTVSMGSIDSERRVTNVAPGVRGTDAANMNQLWSVQNQVNSVARTAYAGIAAATALTMIPDVDAGKNFALGVGVANFGGQTALAIGSSARISDRLKVKLGAGTSSNGTVVGGGASFSW